LVKCLAGGGLLPVEARSVPGGTAALGIDCTREGEEECSRCGGDNGFLIQCSELTDSFDELVNKGCGRPEYGPKVPQRPGLQGVLRLCLTFLGIIVNQTR